MESLAIRQCKPANSDISVETCLARYRLLKYSFIHDTDPTPDGLSSIPIDQSRWSHQTEPELWLHIYPTANSNKTDSNAKSTTASIVILRKFKRNQKPNEILVGSHFLPFLVIKSNIM